MFRVLLAAATVTGCAARWHGPTPPVEAVPSAESAVEDFALPTARLWTLRHNTFLGSAPVAVGSDLAVVDHKGRVVFLDPNSGKVRARAKTKYTLEAPPAWDSERFYVVQPAPRRRLEALRFADGKSLWHRQFTQVPQPPIIHEGELILAAGDSVFALEAASGERKRVVAVSEAPWLVPVNTDSGLLLADARGNVRLIGSSGAGRWEYDLAMPLQARPALTGGDFVFAGLDGQVVKLDAEGREAWRATVGGAPLYRPSVVEGRVFVAGRDGAVSALDLEDGAILWQRALSAPSADGLTARRSWVAANSIDGVLWFLDPAGGAILDTLRFDELIHEPPVWAFGRLFVVTENKKMHALGKGR